LNPPPDVLTATQNYRSENDAVGQFVEARCCLDPKGREMAGKLYGEFELWCRESGMEPIAKNVFGKELRRCGFQSIKGRSGNGWAGLRVQRAE
jgi:putative DNA primase/helicase